MHRPISLPHPQWLKQLTHRNDPQNGLFWEGFRTNIKSGSGWWGFPYVKHSMYIEKCNSLGAVRYSPIWFSYSSTTNIKSGSVLVGFRMFTSSPIRIIITFIFIFIFIPLPKPKKSNVWMLWCCSLWRCPAHFICWKTTNGDGVLISPEGGKKEKRPGHMMIDALFFVSWWVLVALVPLLL